MPSDKSASSGSGNWAVDSSAPRQPERSKPSVSAPGYEAVVGSRCRITGNLEFRGGAQIDGKIEGEIFADGDLIIGESAEIKAVIQGERVRVFGRIVGDIVCSERLELFTGARVTGNLSSPRLVIHDGVVFDGSCRMEEVRGEPIRQTASEAEAAPEPKGAE